MPARSLLSLLAFFLFLAVVGRLSPHPERPPEPGAAGLKATLARLPLPFEPSEELGGAPGGFIARSQGATLALSPMEAVFTLPQPRSMEASPAAAPAQVRMRVVGGDPQARPLREGRLPGVTNYLIGSDPARWRTHVPTYERAGYAEVYPGIDLLYYGHGSRLEYDFIVRPGGDPDQIRLSFAGAERVSIAPSGDLVLTTAAGELRQHRPVVYQQIAGRRVEVPGEYVVLAREGTEGARSGEPQARFRLGRYDRRATLVIDPVLSYGTYLGTVNQESCSDVAVQDNGHAFLAGQTYGTAFPVTANAFQRFAPAANVFSAYVTQISTQETGRPSLVSSTLLNGSSATSSGATAVAVDRSGAVYVAGWTGSDDFPTTAGAFSTSRNTRDNDAFLVKLDLAASGRDQLRYGTYLTGPAMEYVSRLAVDANGRLYVAGYTGSTSFPLVGATGAQPAHSGQWTDGFVAVLDLERPGSAALLYGTFLGGNGSDWVLDLALDSDGSVCVAGWTDSTNYPTTSTRLQGDPGDGATDGFFTRVDPAEVGRSSLAYSTYLGGRSADVASGVALAPNGRVYVGGYTESLDFPLSADAAFNGSSDRDAFLACFDPTAADTASLRYSTRLGGPCYPQYPPRVAADPSGGVWVLATLHYMGSGTFPVTRDALQSSSGGGALCRVNPELPGAAGLAYSTYYGPAAGSVAYRGLAVDSKGSLYVSGETSSALHPVTPTGYQATHVGNWDAVLTKLNPDPPQDPTALQATGLRGRRIALSWRDNSRTELGFEIQLKGSDGRFATVHTTAANATSHTFTGLTAGTPHTYRVRAFNNGGPSGPTGQATATPLPDPPAAPTNLTAVALNATRVDLAWQDHSTDEEAFEIERKLGSGAWEPIAAVGANTQTHVDLTVLASTNYGYRVRAVLGGAGSDYSNEQAVTTPLDRPAAPSGLQAVAPFPTQVNVTWTDRSSTEGGFKLERKPGKKEEPGAWTVMEKGPNVTSHLDTDVAPRSWYTYRVKAWNSAGDSDYSELKEVETPAPAPDPPTALDAQAQSATVIRITWEHPGGAEGFNIYERSAGGAWALIAHVEGSARAHPHANLEPRSSHTYTVTAHNGALESVLGREEVTAQTPAPGSLKVVQKQVNFKRVRASSSGTGRSMTVQVRNEGDGPLLVRVTAPAAPFFLDGGSREFTIEPRRAQGVTVRFAPGRGEKGRKRGVLTFTTADDPQQRDPILVKLVGVAK